jgi:predicted branched-subunit amino acid permease
MSTSSPSLTALAPRTRPSSLPHAGAAAKAGPSPRTLALRDALTVLPGMVPFGIVVGVTIATTGSDPIAGLIGGPAIYGGSAQLTLVTLLDKGFSLLIGLACAIVVNLRLLLYSAVLGDRFRAQPRWFAWLAPHFIIDQTFVMADGRRDLAGASFRQYWGWLGGSVLVVWSGSIAAGIGCGPLLPELPHLALTGTALFVGLLVPRLTSRPAVVAAATGALVGAAVSMWQAGPAIIIGTIAGVAAAAAVKTDD